MLLASLRLLWACSWADASPQLVCWDCNHTDLSGALPDLSPERLLLVGRAGRQTDQIPATSLSSRAALVALIGRVLHATGYKVWLGLEVHCCVWLSSPLFRAGVTLEWCQSLLGLLTGCWGALRGHLLSGTGWMPWICRGTWG